MTAGKTWCECVKAEVDPTACNGCQTGIDDDADDDDAEAEAEMDCGRMPDGGCQLEGTEWCDWSCPFAEEIRRERIAAAKRKAARKLRRRGQGVLKL